MRLWRPGVLATALLSLLVVGVVVAVTARVTQLDLAVYRAGATAIVDRTYLYDAHPPGSLLPFTYPPFAALAFVPLAVVGQETAQALLTLASLLALVRVCVIVLTASRRGSAGMLGGMALLAVVGLALCAEPVARTLSFGQVNLVLMWLVVEDVLGLGARLPRAQGALVGLAAGLKLVPASFALLFLAVGRLRAVVVAGAVFLGTVAVGFLVQPTASRDYWTGLVLDPSRVGDVADWDNQSLLGALSRILPEATARVVWAGAAVVTLVVCVALARWYWRRGLRLAALALVACAGLLCSPISWSHHWVWLVVVVGACAGLAHIRAVLVVGVLAAVAPLSWVVWWGGRSWFATLPGPVAVVVGNAYVVVALAFVAVLWWVRRDVTASAPDGSAAGASGRSRPWPDEREPAVHLP